MVLLVDDNEDARTSRSRLFRQAGCIVIPAATTEDALRELLSSPMVSTIVTDINFNPDNDDQAGIVMVRYIRTKRPDVPIIGYSGIIDDAQIQPRDHDLFTELYPRNARGKTWGQRKAEVDAIADRAKQYHSARRAAAHARLEELREKHHVDVETMEAFLRLLPNGDRLLEQVLRDNEYEALAVQRAGGARTLLTWWREVEGGVEVEVLGMSSLYAFGETRDEAVQDLLELMALYRVDLEGEANTAAEAEELRSFLKRFFE